MCEKDQQWGAALVLLCQTRWRLDPDTIAYTASRGMCEKGCIAGGGDTRAVLVDTSEEARTEHDGKGKGKGVPRTQLLRAHLAAVVRFGHSITRLKITFVAHCSQGYEDQSRMGIRQHF